MPDFSKKPIDLGSPEFAQLVASADVFICAAGFEERAGRALTAAARAHCRNTLVVRYRNGPKENDAAYAAFAARLKKPTMATCELDFNHPEKFERSFEEALAEIKTTGNNEVLLDISGMPNFALCTIIGKVRRASPLTRINVLYTEAKTYFPTEAEYRSSVAIEAQKGEKALPESLSDLAVNNFEPAMFSGAALNHNDTCLMVFAGYEPHRTMCALDHTNARRVVMIYGRPGRSDLDWRLDLSRWLHREIKEQVEMAEEESPTSDVDENLRLILSYYDNLYDDHTFCVCPINSKLQALATVIAWEIYPDIQLRFPLPVNYLARRFSLGWGQTFLLRLGPPLNARKFVR